MLRNVFLKTLRDQVRSLLWWGSSIVSLAFFLVLFYPAVRDSAAGLGQMLESLPPALLAAFVGEMTDITSPAGYLNSQLYFLVGPILFLVFAIAGGSGAIAGEEERGTLELLLSNPLPRWQIVLEKFAALVVSTTLLGLLFWLGLALGASLVDMEISLGNLLAATIQLILLALSLGTLALALGAMRGDRGLAAGVASAIAVVGYFLNALAPSIAALRPYRPLSPFYYYIGANPLVNGMAWGHAAVLAGLTIALLLIGLFTFQRRDVGV